MNAPFMPFGSEYSLRTDWTALQSMYIKLFGVVDLPTRIRARAVTHVLKDYASDTLLDIGAGTGVYSFFYTRKTQCRCTAIDIDLNRIRSIQREVSILGRTNLEAICSNEEGLTSLPSEAFSVVLAIEVLQYFSNLPRTFTNIFNLIKPGGILVAHIPIRDSLWPYEHNLFDQVTLKSILTEAGFEHVQVRFTFGLGARFLTAIFSTLVGWPILLAASYPWLLFAAHLTPRFVPNGTFCLVVAHKSPNKVAETSVA
jgi:Methyltransferase domain.